MAYTKVDQSPFAANLDESRNEFVVQLTDTQNYIAVSCATELEPNSGNPVFKAKARVVNGDGSALVDSMGNPVESTISHTSNAAELTAMGGANVVQTQCLLAVLGEPTTYWNDPLHATVMENASIRNTLAAVPHVGYATASSLL